MPAKIVVASDYTPVKPGTHAWVAPIKAKPVAVRREQLPSSDRDELTRLWELTDKDIEKFRWNDQEDFKQMEKRMGKSMSHQELIRRITQLNSNLLFEKTVSMPDCGAFYLVVDGKKVYTQACFRLGRVPEFTYLVTDAADLPTRDGLHPGWRTVLQRLVQIRAITYRQAVDTFGDVHFGDARGKHWNAAVSKFRS